jgi:hypothetical protein
MLMSYRVLIWVLAAVLLTGVVIAVDIYRERRDEGAVFIASNGPVTEDQVRQKMTAEGWSNVLIMREGRYFQVMGSKNQETGHFTIDSRTGRLRGDEDDD